MSYLLISGSPRKGNTEYVLNKLYEKIKAPKELILLRQMNFQHCIWCLSCHDTQQCVIQDDMTNILDKIMQSHTIILWVPNYFENMPWLLKNFIDRTHPLYVDKKAKWKKLFSILIWWGNRQWTQEILPWSLYWVKKHQAWQDIGSYAIKALDNDDLSKNPNTDNMINEILSLILKAK